jgi:hypothetical protein
MQSCFRDSCASDCVACSLQCMFFFQFIALFPYMNDIQLKYCFIIHHVDALSHSLEYQWCFLLLKQFNKFQNLIS